jgi:hypothetical protein
MNPANKQPKKQDGRKIAGILLVAGPTVLIVLSVMLYALVNFIFSSIPPSSDDLFSNTSPAQSIANIILFSLGTTGFITWLPALIIGIILLATRKKQ